MIKHLKRYTPFPVKAALKWLWSLNFFTKPRLSYLELHLTDHCNINCKGCSHYCSLSPPNYTDLNRYKEDMRRLSQLFRNICSIRIMGGEPLLHKNPSSFIYVTRARFPEADIYFVTNGILLPKAPADFWDACRRTNTAIDLTVYPPFRKHAGEWNSLCTSRGVRVSINYVENFSAYMNLQGDSDKHEAFKVCTRRDCMFLKDGCLYTCQMPAHIKYFNKRFGYEVADDSGVNIHSRWMYGQRILWRLRKPMETCRWCSYDTVFFPWEGAGGKTAAEWDAAEPKKFAEKHSR